jgi:hypothetical protein
MRALLFALVVVTAAGCKKKEVGEATGNKPAETKPAETKPGEPTTPTATPPAEAKAPEAAPPADVPDLCTLLTKEQVEAAMGKVTGDPMKQASQGSFLGSCTWMTEKGSAILSARPANEYDATAAMNKGTDVAGVGEKASMTPTGLLVKLAGKGYFLHIMTMTGSKMDNATAEAIAKAAVSNVK